MGLHAVVYCKCYETGKVRTQPLRPEIVCILDDGSLSTQGLEDFNGLDKWLESHPCEHENGWAVFHYIGNIAKVGFLREQLSKIHDNFPIILSRVLCDGIHSGDYIPVDAVKDMQVEIDRLHRLHLFDPEHENILREFEHQLTELIDCSLQIGKPISF
jgi:hypothetical protein